MKKEKIIRGSVISTFVILYLMVSIISTIHVIDFFELSNPYWLAVTLAIAFEVGAAASLASLVILDKMNRGLVWTLFIAITLMQMQGNMYYAFTNLQDFTSWSELFALIEEEIIFQKRVIAAVSGAILPLVALGFIKSLVDYIKPEKSIKTEVIELESEVDSELESEVDYLSSLQKEANLDIKEKQESNLESIIPESIKEDIKEEFVEETENEENEEDEFSYTSEEIDEWDITLMDGLEELEETELDMDGLEESEEESEHFKDLNTIGGLTVPEHNGFGEFIEKEESIESDQEIQEEKKS